MDIRHFREDFPILVRGIDGKPVVYFDNACTTLRPRQVMAAMDDYYENYPACGGRSLHKLADKVTRKTEEAREAIAKFLNAKKAEEIIFTRNTTEGINLIAHSLDWTAGDIVVVSDKEHNSNLVPWHVLAKEKGIVLHVLPSKPDNTFDVERFESFVSSHNVKLVSLGHASNLDGVTIPAKDIIAIAHTYGALVMLDGAQSVPHQEIDVQDLDVDFLAFSAHKMCGPSGMGALYGKMSLLEKLKPFLVGGDTVSNTTYESHEYLPVPGKFEAGLQNYAGIIGFGEATGYLHSIGMKNIHAQELALNGYVTEAIKGIPKLHIIGPADADKRGGIVAFHVDGVDSHQIAIMLDQSSDIMVRSGQHCVHSWFNAHGIRTSVRASFYFYNTPEEAERFVTALKKTIAILS